jgi:hypothetical protein
MISNTYKLDTSKNMIDYVHQHKLLSAKYKHPVIYRASLRMRTVPSQDVVMVPLTDSEPVLSS